MVFDVPTIVTGKAPRRPGCEGGPEAQVSASDNTCSPGTPKCPGAAQRACCCDRTSKESSSSCEGGPESQIPIPTCDDACNAQLEENLPAGHHSGLGAASGTPTAFPSPASMLEVPLCVPPPAGSLPKPWYASRDARFQAP